MKYIDLAELPANKAYKWMTSIIVPRPIAWILTDNDNGTKNLAPFSFFNGVCSDPPMVMVSFYPKSPKPNTEAKDTLQNILKNKEATIHIADFAHLDEVNKSSYDYAYGISELSELNLTIKETLKVRCGWIAEAPVAMEAKYRNHFEVGNSPCTVVLFELTGIHLSKDWGHSADISELDPLMRLGAVDYGRVDMSSIVSRNRIIKPKKD
jgi:flavin reductase (DIM6/NTAB) family NADH-FMN oxidoreductase RutF